MPIPWQWLIFLTFSRFNTVKFKLSWLVEIHKVKHNLSLYSVWVVSSPAGSSSPWSELWKPSLHSSATWQIATSLGSSTNLYWLLPKLLRRAVNPPREVLQPPTEEARPAMSQKGIGLGAFFFQSSEMFWIPLSINCDLGSRALRAVEVQGWMTLGFGSFSQE